MEYDIFDNDTKFKFMEDKVITIIVLNYGRKYITYIKNWDIQPKELSNHLKIIKKLYGCNGTIKNGIIQLQGDHKKKLHEYLNTI